MEYDMKADMEVDNVSQIDENENDNAESDGIDLSSPEEYKKLMDSLLKLTTTLQDVENDVLKKIEQSHVSWDPTNVATNSESNLQEKYPYLKLREKICECVSKNISNLTTDSTNNSELTKIFSDFNKQALFVKKENQKNAIKRDKNKINEAIKLMQMIANDLFIKINNNCIEELSNDEKNSYKIYLADQKYMRIITSTCITTNKLNPLLKQIKSSNIQYVYNQLINYIIKGIDNIHFEDEPLNVEEGTVFGANTEHSSNKEFIRAFYPVLFALDNINNSLINNFNKKVKNLLGFPNASGVQQSGNVIINKSQIEAYLDENTDPLKGQICARYKEIANLPQSNDVPFLANNNNNTNLINKQHSGNQILDLYKRVKQLSDLADLTHDTEKYFNYLENTRNLIDELKKNEFLKTYKILEKDFSKVFPVPGNPGNPDNSKNANQLKLREFRDILNSVYIQFLNDQNIPFQKPVTEELTEAQGYFKLILSIKENQEKFIYVEAGRAPSIEKLNQYYSSSDKDVFVEECNNYLGTSFSKEDIENLITPSTGNKIDLMVNKELITNFDGAGCSKGFINQCGECQFDYVFGYYTYKIYSVQPDRAQFNIYHLVVVTFTNNDPEPDIQAVFGFEGNVTINMLLTIAAIPKSRSGEGGKGKPYSISDIIIKYNQNCKPGIKIDLKDVYSNAGKGLPNFNVNDDSFFFKKDLTDEVKQLLFLGNKTVGDFVIGCYKSVKDGYTGDSGVSPSNILIFCGPTSGYLEGTLPNIWRSKTGKGWVFTAGVTKPDKIQQITSFFEQYLSIYKLAQLTHKDTFDNELKQLFTLINYEKSSSGQREYALDENLTRFDVLYEYVYDEFPKIINYKLKEENLYDKCFVQLFVAENYVMKQNIIKFVDDGLNILKENSSNQHLFSKMMSLPKVPYLFLSKMATEAINNQDTSLINDILELYPPVNGTFTVSYLTNDIISFEYQSKITPTVSTSYIGSKDTKIEITPDIKFDSQRKQLGKDIPNKCSIENYTIESLMVIYKYINNGNVIQSYGEENIMSFGENIKTRIKNYFNTLIENLNIDNNELTKTLQENLTIILREASVLDENDELSLEITNPIYEEESQSVFNCPNEAFDLFASPPVVTEQIKPRKENESRNRAITGFEMDDRKRPRQIMQPRYQQPTASSLAKQREQPEQLQQPILKKQKKGGKRITKKKQKKSKKKSTKKHCKSSKSNQQITKKNKKQKKMLKTRRIKKY
jgi:hypothetical protein